MSRGTPGRRVAAIAGLGLLPWTVLVVGSDVTTLVFLPGLLEFDPGAVPPVRPLPLWTVLEAGGGLPRNPELWPLSLGIYCLALASAGAGLVRDENARLTAGLLVLAAVTHLGVSYAFRHRIGYVPIPLGPVAALALAWWYYWPALRSALLFPAE